jgi:uncharacterized membrane protein YraQ (UPF0718 family)
VVGKRKKLALGGWLFLLLVLVVYGVVGATDSTLFDNALAFFGQVIRQVLPVLALVFLMLLAADLLLQPAWIERHLGQKAGIKAWFMALFGGVLSTGPIYPWYALLRELRQKGMQTPLVAVFLYSRAVKVPLLPLMIHYFGATYTLVLCLYLLCFAMVNGLLMLKVR